MIFHMKNCGACRTCEIMCCFHHTGTFGSSPTSLQVKENPDGEGYIIVLAEMDGGGIISCDACEDLDVPLCVEVCKEADELKGYINAVMEEQRKLRRAG